MGFIGFKCTKFDQPNPTRQTFGNPSDEFR